jgi:outer membrane immunogenic protein
MTKSLISGTALSLVLTASVFAADLPDNKPPVYVPPPPPMWTGFYAGLNAGGT